MTKRKLNLYAQTLPLHDTKQGSLTFLNVSHYLSSLSRFTEENFSAAAKIEISEPIYGTAALSLENSALFFQKLLRTVMGKHFITVRAGAAEGVLTISITGSGGILLEINECLELMKTAKNAGFEPCFENGEILLKAKMHLKQFSTIYAHDLDRDEFYFVLSALFFQ